ncbi:fluoride efflux transporter FluC [Microlunatus soli]|uniref:Fluoride-specific ion channel FluC n=1 Tax=Microlunatus soli TaxID=630515 RepID=A0A1H1YHL9_9ACTN|nr:CrcB family protein [Microlunatus soli]SDT20980.1 CrcB protein [Microlunatus soli]
MESRTIPPHLRPSYLVIVGAGGAFGAAARYVITESAAPVLSAPSATFLINLGGALLLGVLLEAWACRGPDVGPRRMLRLLLGTGVLGGFTTYSTLALDAAAFLRAGQPLLMIGYALGSVLLGVVAAAVGIVIAGRLHRRTGRRP